MYTLLNSSRITNNCLKRPHLIPFKPRRKNSNKIFHSYSMYCFFQEQTMFCGLWRMRYFLQICCKIAPARGNLWIKFLLIVPSSPRILFGSCFDSNQFGFCCFFMFLSSLLFMILHFTSLLLVWFQFLPGEKFKKGAYVHSLADFIRKPLTKTCFLHVMNETSLFSLYLEQLLITCE